RGRAAHCRRAGLVRSRARIDRCARPPSARPAAQGGRLRGDGPLLPPGGAGGPRPTGRTGIAALCAGKERLVISFKMTEEQELARDAMHEFAEQAMRPIARECDEASAVPADFLEQVQSLGLVSTAIPESYGGGGEARSPITNAIVLEELAWGDATLAV